MGIDTINNNINAVLGGAITARRKPLPGCVLSYDFLDKVASGGKIIDRSGRGNHGTVTGNCCAVGDGIARFRSNADKITLPAATDTNGLASITNGFTASWWVKINSDQWFSIRLAMNATNSISMGSQTFTIGQPGVGSDYKYLNSKNSMIGRWSHIIAKWIPGVSVQFIQDGVAYNPVSWTKTLTSIVGEAGIINYGAASSYSVDLGILELYNRILTDEECRYLYESDAHKYTNTVPGNIALSLQFTETNTSGNNGITIDTSGYIGRSGTWNNAANPDVLYVPGPNYVNDSSQKVVAFDGGNDYIKIPTTDGQPALGYNPNSYTFMTWINQRAASNATGNGAAACHLFAWNDGTNDKEYIGLNEKYQDTTINEGMITYLRSALAIYGEAWQPMSNQYLKSAEWHHLAVVVENRTQTSPDTMMAVRFFIDGSLVYTTFTSPSGAISDLSTCGIRIGMGKSGAAFSGCLKDIKLRMSALSNADVLAYYNSTKGDYPAADSTILLDMPLDDNTQAGDGTNITQIAKDVSHRCLHGTWNAGCSAAALAPDGVTKVAVFDGVDDRVTIPYSPSFRLNGDWSIGFWMNQTDPASNYPYVLTCGNMTVAQAGWGIMAASSSIRFYRDNIGKIFTGVFTYGVWHHIAVTYNASSGLLKGYIDGLPVLSFTQSYNQGTHYNTSLYIGGTSFGGKVWNPRIRNVALDANGVKAAYNANCLKFGLPQI